MVDKVFSKCSSKQKKFENLCNYPIFKTRKTCFLVKQCLIHTKSRDYHSLLRKNCFLSDYYKKFNRSFSK